MFLLKQMYLHFTKPQNIVSFYSGMLIKFQLQMLNVTPKN
jgi:hypothetical protein